MGIKILVIDDDKILGEMLQMLLEYKGHEVIVSKVPEGTIDLILENDIEIVMLDKLLAGVDGTEVCRKLKNNQNTARVPILMMSALNNAARVCKDAGADEFISKPFDMKDLYFKIDKVLNNNPSSNPP